MALDKAKIVEDLSNATVIEIAELDRLKVHFGYLNNKRLEQAEIMMLADLPSLEVLRAKLLGLFSAPASKLVRLLNTPASQMARVLQARADKPAEASAPAGQ